MTDPMDLDALERKVKDGWWTQPVADAMLALIARLRAQDAEIVRLTEQVRTLGKDVELWLP